MKNILIIGAGRSATALINYILGEAQKYDWSVTVADFSLPLAKSKVNNHPSGKAVRLDVMKEEERQDLIQQADVVASLLPAHLHIKIAHDCLMLNKHLVTASYISKDMQQLNDDAQKKELIFMGEIGLDPGIDHMSAMQKINEIKAEGGHLYTFRSYTGGLISPEYVENNPWKYKFTWNPRNVVLAGQSTAQYLEKGKVKYIPYNRLFSSCRKLKVTDFKYPLEVYANRDSLPYREIYGLEDIPTILRGTIRYGGFCEAWNALVKIGLTDDAYQVVDSESITYLEWVASYFGNKHKGKTIKEKIAHLLGEKSADSVILQKLEWLGLFEPEKINLQKATPAQILENLLLKKWKLKSDDKDLIIMRHEFEYEQDGENYLSTSTLLQKGKDAVDTAMANLVGLPVGIFVKLIMQGKVSVKGVNIPVMKEVYEPVLKELESFGVIFKEETHLIGIKSVQKEEQKV